jgi:hypothetical protein
MVDAARIADHHWLELGDTCLYMWEYARREGFAHSAVNSLILNFKRNLPDIAEDPRKAAHKRRAIDHFGAALRALIEPQGLIGDATIVPIPPSKTAGHPDHDDRLLKTLLLATAGHDADIRHLIQRTRSTAADHESTTRISLDDLRSITRIDQRVAARPVRSTLIVFDDVLNSGKHFKIAQDVLHQRFPRSAIVGLFHARKVCKENCFPEGSSIDSESTVANPAVVASLERPSGSINLITGVSRFRLLYGDCDTTL